MSSLHERLRALPAVHQVLTDPAVIRACEVWGIDRAHATRVIQKTIAALREALRSGERTAITREEVADACVAALRDLAAPRLRPVINGTGIVLHTNLGRAVLAAEAAEAMTQAARHYTNLEFELDSGTRGSRHALVEGIICHLTGAEAAMVVNNNAAAVLLALRALAAGKDVIVSRGELVEIGGSFRVPDIMAESGARLVEVGTTNRTRLADYEQAITDETALLLKVHRSNFRIVGFTESVSAAELAALGQRRGIPVYEDLGSGVLFDLRPFGIGNEPTVQDSLQAGVALVSFSGDKLLGGPQAGILAGRRDLIQRLKRHPLARALRCDKFTLAALEATLRLYLDPEQAKARIPTLRMLLATPSEIAARARRYVAEIARYYPGNVELFDDHSEAGGGSLPGVTLPTVVVAFGPHPDWPAHRLERRFRLGDPPVVGRVKDDRFLLDFRTIRDEDLPALVARTRELLTRNSNNTPSHP